LFYLVMVFATILYLDFATNHGEKIAVPNLVGISGERAKNRIEELDLTYQILDSIYDPSLPEGTVVEQLVEPTSLSQVYVKSGRIIGLRLSKKSQLKLSTILTRLGRCEIRRRSSSDCKSHRCNRCHNTC
jgi:beta-lactam-binding protein with PASTA domain